MDKRDFIGGAFRGLLTGGSWMRLAMWARKSDSREINVHLQYIDSQATWELSLVEGKSDVYRGSGVSLEEVTIKAVAALGKSL